MTILFTTGDILTKSIYLRYGGSRVLKTSLFVDSSFQGCLHRVDLQGLVKLTGSSSDNLRSSVVAFVVFAGPSDCEAWWRDLFILYIKPSLQMHEKLTRFKNMHSSGSRGLFSSQTRYYCICQYWHRTVLNIFHIIWRNWGWCNPFYEEFARNVCIISEISQY